MDQTRNIAPQMVHELTEWLRFRRPPVSNEQATHRNQPNNDLPFRSGNNARQDQQTDVGQHPSVTGHCALTPAGRPPSLRDQHGHKDEEQQ